MVKFDNDKYEFEVAREHILALQICSNCPPSEMDKLEEAVRLHHESGTSAGWVLEKEGERAPVKCADHADRWHYLFLC